MWLINTLWKSQNWFGRILLILIVLLVGVALYYRVVYGVYKHKYVQGLVFQKNELIYENEQLRNQRKVNNTSIKNKATELILNKDKIEQKRIQDEESINNSTITDKQRRDFLSKYENR
ncbi:hypothetical protein MHM83_10865 [Tenacibaculum sp. Mcav3-52]|uniref:hypothetical protein n=1 Tax=Tenacibaculum sp. Mcav3-52 TaxID=2917762 RepID=UPI001EF2B538|nr:hypothetical protein [Tenacibaculum sp. Mcav3-52]MCG7502373.1 hypothetical protein [Tenacibaculum sp. Mcav3-52]